MRLIGQFLLVLVTAGSLSAQRGGPAAAGGGMGASRGFGNVVFPGTGRAPAGNPFSVADPGFAARLGSVVSGDLRNGYPPVRGGGRGGQRGPVVVPYPYPVFVGGGGYGYYPEESSPNVTIINPAPAVPQVIVNQGYTPETANPVIREYPAEGSPDVRIYEAPSRAPADTSSSSSQTGSSYLVAFKDHSIYSAMAYWVQGDTLHYVTPQGVHNQASLDLIDRDFTEQLNRERNLRFSVSKK
jgi:hypothetical protein